MIKYPKNSNNPNPKLKKIKNKKSTPITDKIIRNLRSGAQFSCCICIYRRQDINFILGLLMDGTHTHADQEPLENHMTSQEGPMFHTHNC